MWCATAAKQPQMNIVIMLAGTGQLNPLPHSRSISLVRGKFGNRPSCSFENPAAMYFVVDRVSVVEIDAM